MHFELLIRPIRCPVLELMSMELEDEWLPLLISTFLLLLLLLLQRHFKPEDSLLLGHNLQLIPFRDNFQCMFRVLHHNPAQAYSAWTSAPYNLHESTMVVGGHQHGTRATRVDVCFACFQAKDLSHVVAPHTMQRLIGGVLALVLGDVIDA